MKGYKVTTNMKCRTLTYEVGKTYNINKLELCSQGFHFCQKMEDVLNYYKYDEDFVLLEVEALGKTITDSDKTVTDSLKIIRVIPKEEYTFEIPIMPIREYDDRGNMVSVTYPGDYKISWEYDDRGNKISVTYPSGNKIYIGRNDSGHISNLTFFGGHKYSYEYDDRGNMISMLDCNNVTHYYEYDDRGNMILEATSNNNETSWEYDDQNNMISETFNGDESYRITIN